MKMFTSTNFQDWIWGITFAFLVMGMVSIGGHLFEQYRISKELTAPIDEWIVVSRLEVDGKFETPLVYFERKVKRDLSGNWTVSVSDTVTGRTACTGNGSANYLMKEKEHLIFDLPEFINVKDCILLSGRSYKLDVNWFFVDPLTNLTKSLWVESNVFDYSP